MAESTRWKDIYIHLKKCGFEVYSPAQHKGECLSPYVVIKDSGTLQLQQFSSTVTLYEVMCYVPADQYSLLQEYVELVKVSMGDLRPMLVYNMYETPPFYDDTVKAHMTSIQYKNYRYLPI